jgi:GDP-L-fucose synthase
MTQLYDLAGKKVYVAGHRGMVGAALVRRLAAEECDVLTVSHAELDLIDQQAVQAWMQENRPDAMFIAAGKVGGINANNNLPAEFIYQNLMIEANLIEAARQCALQKVLFLGSSCIYPRMAPQPIPEEALLSGPLELTNQWYAIAKIAGVKLCEAYRLQYGCDFISAMPTNLYGPGDNFDLFSSHVPAALMRRFHEAKVTGQPTVSVWGTGTPLREFLYVDDMADACVFLMKHYSAAEHINVGSGDEMTIADLARVIQKTVGYKGPLRFDTSKPDGTPRKLIASDKLHDLGWRHNTSLENGMRVTYQWFLENAERARF